MRQAKVSNIIETRQAKRDASNAQAATAIEQHMRAASTGVYTPTSVPEEK
jgi:hypothetical protein